MQSVRSLSCILAISSILAVSGCDKTNPSAATVVISNSSAGSSNTSDTNIDIGDSVCNLEGEKIGEVEKVYKDKIQVRIHHYEAGTSGDWSFAHGSSPGKPSTAWETLDWMKNNEVISCADKVRMGLIEKKREAEQAEAAKEEEARQAEAAKEEAKEEQDRQAKLAEQQRVAAEMQRKATEELNRKLEAVKNACASGQKMKILGGPLHPDKLQGAGLVNQYVYNGQVVEALPDGTAPSYSCHVQYPVGNRIASGYVPFGSLEPLE
jgi:pyruvate/2-oxoglutarate dehydrogenase complex dihydrolipoamide acyltransferase (E2) component